jgi:ATPase subunit of ABC transporter with duplicated ATPase domains
VPALHLEGLAFAWSDAVPLIEPTDLVLPSGLTGLVGENGGGKTTLLRLVAGELRPASGRVRTDPPGAPILLCPQGVERAGAAEAALAGRGDGEARRLRAALGLDPADLARWASLSPGERRRWQLGGALAADPAVLLLDEPTHHADAAARNALVRALRTFRGVALVVSHDRALLDELTTRTLRLHRGEARLWPFAYGEAREAWRAEERAAWDARAAAQEEARRAARRLADARRARATADAARSGRNRKRGDSDSRSLGTKTRVAWAEDRLGREVSKLRREVDRARGSIPDAPDAEAAGRAISVGWERPARPWLLALDGGGLRAGGAPGGRLLVEGAALRLGRDDRVRLAGANGAGKTTLLEALLARSTLPPERVLHLPQELPPGAGPRLLEEVRALERDARGRVLSLVAALGSDPDRLLAGGAPSPGEARKVALALGLGRHAWALVLDEPTNHLDLPAVERLEAALGAYPGALLLVTHDDRLAAAVTRTVWRIASGSVVVE